MGDLVKASGVSARSLRYYEEQGLIVASRTSGNHREFLDCAPLRVAWIQRLYAAGLNSNQIGQLLPHMNELTSSHENPGRYIPDHVKSQIDEQLASLDARIDELVQSRDRLRELASSVSGDDLPD
ncbi:MULTISPECIES: MerR family DNA-binding transcriptional regulator [Nocardiaceae]|uniref:MerR family DNA-binding transcriptional regulator n=1 Tax=Rhodococcoides kroppenstedtii TaxID=293050 RepID=A0ABS7NNM3_9NOCA|nr:MULTISPECIES: MerR family DNA-binding transcriptional regulator [Rhodococcus]AMY19576.1 HTH-type transcriptional regulator CueR [Rhodococcus sp. PBTS 1]MBY6319609.1 MerR family DNA-binding transcriptional regulator [Rhodococcus kroppenstedtii]MBY6438617.1 MerR family DNA-binding transcriptional regulator [Rhodococcus kroppenstedtii]